MGFDLIAAENLAQVNCERVGEEVGEGAKERPV
jgi:hypothetical protein